MKNKKSIWIYEQEYEKICELSETTSIPKIELLSQIIKAGLKALTQKKENK